MRIRPYVNLEAPDEDDSAHVPLPPEQPVGHQVSATTVQPVVVPPVMAPLPPQPAAAPEEEPAELTMPLLLDRAAFAEEPEREHGGRKRGVLVALVAALAVAGTAAFAAGILGGDEPVDRAAPDATATSSTASMVSEAPSPTASESATESASPSASASPTKSASASPSPSRKAATRPAAPPRPTASSSAPSRPASTPPTGDPEDGGRTLRHGDSGPDVSELQRRLKEIWAYKGPENGYYGERVEEAVADFQSYMDIDEDPWGVYGPATREALEAVTEG
ncbi:peptidoglycan-binding protein [Streptomyces sp. NPDC048604]|uniref:peptidoglycan-binding domain-containing protein n=1 Tax=Streptomyces sp. NPDC048604 TaxID=3365578 RepID=UPI0037134F59